MDVSRFNVKNSKELKWNRTHNTEIDVKEVVVNVGPGVWRCPHRRDIRIWRVWDSSEVQIVI
jgi:hypothetical protein